MVGGISVGATFAIFGLLILVAAILFAVFLCNKDKKWWCIGEKMSVQIDFMRE